MKNENGFTLVEIVVTIAIMLAIVGIAVPSAIGLSNKSKKKSYDLQIKEFESAAKSYALENKNKWNVDNISNRGKNYCFTLKDLKKSGYIEEIPKNPITNKDFTGSVQITIDTSDDMKVLKYTYSDKNCEDYNRIVMDDSLKELENYDKYLELANNTNNNGDNYTGDAIAVFDGVTRSRNYTTDLKDDIDPGIYCFDSNNCAFVGPVENNYIKIEGINYEEDTEYVGQKGQPILWRVISYDKENNKIKLIPDLSIGESIYNEFDSENYEQAIDATKFIINKYSLTFSEYYEIYKKDLGINENLDSIDVIQNSNLENYNYDSLLKYWDIGHNQYTNLEQLKYLKPKDDDHILITDSGSFNNVKKIYEVINKPTWVSDKRDYIYKVREIKVDESTKKQTKSSILMYIENWFNKNNLSTKKSKNNLIFSKNDYCYDYVNGVNTDSKCDIYTAGFKSCIENITRYSTTSGTSAKGVYSNIGCISQDEGGYENKVKNCSKNYNSYVGLLSVYEYYYMGGEYTRNTDRYFTSKPVTSSTYNKEQTMFKYTKSFYASSPDFVVRDDRDKNVTTYSSMMYIIGGSSVNANQSHNVRPVVTINGNVYINGGNGTRLNPWIIKVD